MHPDCPLCGFQLRGHKSSGFRCVKCHAHYSSGFVRKLRRIDFKHTVAERFGTPEKADEVVVLPEDVLTEQVRQVSVQSLDELFEERKVEESPEFEKQFKKDFFERRKRYDEV